MANSGKLIQKFSEISVFQIMSKTVSLEKSSLFAYAMYWMSFLDIGLRHAGHDMPLDSLTGDWMSFPIERSRI